MQGKYWQSSHLRRWACLQTPARKGTKPPKEEAKVSTAKSELREVFSAFASFGARASSDGASELDGQKFAKLCRESLLVGNGFSGTSVDIIFTKVKAKVN